MKKGSVLFLAGLIFLFSCKKNILQAKADFNLSGPFGGWVIRNGDTCFIIGTHEQLIFHNRSLNADLIQWNFGNGKISNSGDTSITYDTPGNYVVTLTAFNNNKPTSSASVKVIVTERVVKSIAINNLQLNQFTPNQPGLPVFSKADLWVEIKFTDAWDTVTSNGDVLAPVIYQSPVFSNVDSGFHSSLIYNLPVLNKVVVNYPVHLSDLPVSYPQGGWGTIVNLYGKNSTGTYLLASSRWGGLQIFNWGNPALVENFSLQFSIPASSNVIQLNCLYQ